MYRRRDGQCGYNPLPHCIAITRISEGEQQEKTNSSERLRLASYTLIWRYLASIHKPISPSHFCTQYRSSSNSRNNSNCDLFRRTFAGSVHTAASDARPTKHKWNMCIGTASLLLWTLGVRGSVSHLQWRGSWFSSGSRTKLTTWKCTTTS